MTRQFKLKFLDNIPNELDEGVLYISMKYHTTAHLLLRRTRSYFLTLMMTCHIEEGTFVD